MTEQIRRDGIRAMIQEAIIVIVNGDSYRVEYCGNDNFCGTDEANHDLVHILYDEVDLSRDKIFKLVLMNPVKAAYEDGRCPDCGDTIPDGVEAGESCDTCGHVFCAITPNSD